MPELGTEYRVNDRVQRRVEVAQPQEEGEDRVANLAALAEWHQQRGDEERQPADDKGTGDDGQCFRCLPLPLRLERLFAFRHLCLRIVGRARRDDSAVLHGSGHLTRGRRQLLVDQLDQVVRLLSRRGGRGQRLALHRDGSGRDRSQVRLLMPAVVVVGITSAITIGATIYYVITIIVTVAAAVAAIHSTVRHRVRIRVRLRGLLAVAHFAAHYKMGHCRDLLPLTRNGRHHGRRGRLLSNL